MRLATKCNKEKVGRCLGGNDPGAIDIPCSLLSLVSCCLLGSGLPCYAFGMYFSLPQLRSLPLPPCMVWPSVDTGALQDTVAGVGHAACKTVLLSWSRPVKSCPIRQFAMPSPPELLPTEACKSQPAWWIFRIPFIPLISPFYSLPPHK